MIILRNKMLTGGTLSLDESRTVQDIMPDSSECEHMLAKIIKDGYKMSSRRITSDIPDSFSDEQAQRRRFRYKNDYPMLGPWFGMNLTLYLDLLPLHKMKLVREFLHMVNIFRIRRMDDLRKQLKSVSEWAKKCGETMFPNRLWMLLVNLETLTGYLDIDDVDDVFGDVEKWVGEVREHALDDGDWNELFVNGVDTFIRKCAVSPANVRVLPLDMWVADVAIWARSGSTRYKSSVTVNGKKSLKNKWSTALSMEPEKIVKLMLDTKLVKQEPRVVVKREKGKVRVVISSDDLLYWRMSYVGTWIESMMQNHPNSSLLISKKRKKDIWTHCWRLLNNGSTAVPLDQSHFDWQPTKRMILDTMDRWRLAMLEYEDNWTTRLIWDLIMKTMDNYTLVSFVNVARKPVTYRSGLLSGLRWTALLGTVINAAEFFAIKAHLSTLGYPPIVDQFLAQGDDDLLMLGNKMDTLTILGGYQEADIDVNPWKFFVSNVRQEYLRLVMEDGYVGGYPARSVSALTERGPLSIDPGKGPSRVSTLIRNWIIFCSRMGCDVNRNFWSLILQDLHGASGSDVNTIVDWILTPASLGGFGLGSEGRTKLVYDYPDFVNKNSKDIVKVEGMADLLIPVPDDELSLEYDRAARPDYHKKVNSSVGYARILQQKKYKNTKNKKHSEWFKFLQSNLASIIDPENQELESHFENVELISSSRALSAKASIALKPIVAYGIVTTSRLSLLFAVRHKQWQWIRDHYIDRKSRIISNQIERRGGRRVWIDWLMGDLPFKRPVSLNLSDDEVDLIYVPIARRWWGGLVSSGRSFSLNDVKIAANFAEDECRNAMYDGVLPLLGR
jgi:hypothetical protein